jgi:DNA-binding XRE family transcriptional regulator
MKKSASPVQWTPEDRARHKAIRERFERDQPSLEELTASGEFNKSVLNGMYFALRQIVAALKAAREEAGLSLADVARCSGLGKAALSRLENGQQINPTLSTLYRYAAAVGKQPTWGLQDTHVQNHEENGTPPKARVRQKKE